MSEVRRCVWVLCQSRCVESWFVMMIVPHPPTESPDPIYHPQYSSCSPHHTTSHEICLTRTQHCHQAPQTQQQQHPQPSQHLPQSSPTYTGHPVASPTNPTNVTAPAPTHQQPGVQRPTATQSGSFTSFTRIRHPPPLDQQNDHHGLGSNRAAYILRTRSRNATNAHIIYRMSFVGLSPQ